MKARAAERASQPEYREAVNSAFRIKYSTDPQYRQSVLDRMRDNRADDVKNRVIRSRAAAYYQRNRKRIVAQNTKRAAENPRIRIRGFMRGRISEALSSHGKLKGGVASLQYLNYSWEDLYRHLESQFADWMNFSNYGSGPGTWQVDHIIPQVFFPYDDMDSELFRWCWDLKNLRPHPSDLNAQEDDRRHLLGDPRDIRLLFQELRLPRVELKENQQDVLCAAARIQPVAGACSMSMVGLNFLDSIFTTRFGSSTARFPSLEKALLNDQMLYEAVICLIKREERVTPGAVHSAIRYRVRTPGHFFPMAAVSVLKRYGMGMHVFDPFLGWGGRCMAALCTDVSSYTGCDLQSEVVNGCSTLAHAFGSPRPVTVLHVDALEFLKSTSQKFGLIFTSPPYMDTEDYGIESDAMRAGWLDSFVFPLVEQFSTHLEHGGRVALHLKDVKGAPTFTAYHAAMKAYGFVQTGRHKYGRTWTQSVYVYERPS